MKEEKNTGNLQNIKRTMHFIFDPQSSKSMEVAAELSRINLNQKLRINTNALKRVLGTDTLRHIVITRTNKETVFTEEDLEDEALRIVICEELPDVVLKKQSHCIEARWSDTPKPDTWYSTKTDKTTVRYFSTAEQAIRIIEDIMFDIQMFYYYNFDELDLEQRRLFSKNKALYKKLPNTHYISLATGCRNDDGSLNILQYIDEWESFYSQMYKPNRKDIPEIVRCLIGVSSNVNQISKRKLSKMLAKLESGRYILVRTVKKPHSKKMRKILCSMIGARRWRTGFIAIRPYKLQDSYERFNEYLDIQAFEV